jgi:hypothetical protein
MISAQFPEAGTSYEGGTSDGWEYRLIFTGNRLSDVYNMVLAFLQEEGFGALPVPKDAAELRHFKSPKGKQPSLFDLNGYVHNPIKVLFLPAQGRRVVLGLYIYNQEIEGHLLLFHGLKPG